MVEGGSAVLTGFLAGGFADELTLAVAPIFVGDSRAPRLVGEGTFPRMRLARTRTVGGTAVLDYLLTRAAVDRFWLAAAIEESRRCPPSATAFSVGAIVLDADGRELARGHSREGGDPHVHAEEAALAKITGGDTIYSSLEPCSVRGSRPRPCAELIRAAGLRRVVYAWREPELFVDGRGAEELAAAGVEVVEIPDLSYIARSVNRHLLH
jgi:5-amino-6-(5-phosphoribosylamino)uracil reductase